MQAKYNARAIDKFGEKSTHAAFLAADRRRSSRRCVFRIPSESRLPSSRAAPVANERRLSYAPREGEEGPAAAAAAAPAIADADAADAASPDVAVGRGCRRGVERVGWVAKKSNARSQSLVTRFSQRTLRTSKFNQPRASAVGIQYQHPTEKESERAFDSSSDGRCCVCAMPPLLPPSDVPLSRARPWMGGARRPPWSMVVVVVVVANLVHRRQERGRKEPHCAGGGQTSPPTGIKFSF